MKILVTGGAGFIGSHIVDRLIDKYNVKVVVVDDLSWGFREDVHPRAKFVKLNILNEEVLSRYMVDCYAVVHCAASLEVTLSQDNPAKDIQSNLLGTLAVLNAMRRAGVKNLVNFSSACVYGPGVYGQSATFEDSVCLTSPQWGYGSSKLAAEIYCNQYAKTYGMRVAHIRPGITCGPREWYGRVLTIFLKRALEGKPLVVFGDGFEERDFVHVYDVRNLAIEALRKIEQIHMSAFNGGTGKATRIIDLANSIGSHFGVPVSHEQVDEGHTSKEIEGRIRLPFEMKSMRLSVKKSRSELGYTSHFTLNEIVNDEIDWLRTGNMNRWERKMKV